jgi:hypothetical protein
MLEDEVGKDIYIYIYFNFIFFENELCWKVDTNYGKIRPDRYIFLKFKKKGCATLWPCHLHKKKYVKAKRRRIMETQNNSP